jgi:LppP/LprE lipoprotein
MGGMATTAHDPGAVRRPHRRPPRRTRWPRRIGGVLATAGLLGVAVLMWTMVAPSKETTTTLTPDAPAATPTPAAKSQAKAKRKSKPGLTKAQLAARTEAVGLMRRQGYLPTRLSDYHPEHELRVLIGYRNGDPLGPRRAFFFVGKRSIGNDSAGGSSKLVVGKSGKRWVRLAYGVYAPGAKPCCPASTTRVRFEWTGTALVPQGTIPLGRVATG